MPDTANETPPAEANKTQPGQTISPDSPTSIPQAPPSPITEKTAPLEVAMPIEPQPLPPAPVSPYALQTEEPPSTSEEQAGDNASVKTDVITWSASEYVEHEKNASWYLLLGSAAILLAAVLSLITRDTIPAVVVIFGAVVLGIYGARPPQQVTYQLDKSGLTIGQRQLPYSIFRSFAVVPEGGINSIVFVHHKRFAPLTTIYLAPDQEESAVSSLSKYLPLEEHRIDAVEHLMRRIRF